MMFKGTSTGKSYLAPLMFKETSTEKKLFSADEGKGILKSVHQSTECIRTINNII